MNLEGPCNCFVCMAVAGSRSFDVAVVGAHMKKNDTRRDRVIEARTLRLVRPLRKGSGFSTNDESRSNLLGANQTSYLDFQSPSGLFPSQSTCGTRSRSVKLS